MSWSEILGFATGAVTVWLTVKENVWNWPIGLANNAFFIVLFLQAGLYADTGLQVVYIVLGVLGWYWWLHGGARGGELHVSRVGGPLALALALTGVVATYGMTRLLESISDSAPFPDALTTVLSLVAQLLLTKKYLENWYVWITADVIYVGLYAWKDLYLTAALYAVFLAMCLVGLRQWRASLARGRATAALPVAG